MSFIRHYCGEMSDTGGGVGGQTRYK